MIIRNRMAWPPTSADLVENNVDIPDLVYTLLAWVLCGDSDDDAISTDRPTLSDKKHRHIMSIAQDLLHCVSGGRVMTSVTVKHLTGSSQLVEILNNFGHSLLNIIQHYSTLIQEVKTAMTEIHIGLVEDGAIHTPLNIQPNVPVVMWTTLTSTKKL